MLDGLVKQALRKTVKGGLFFDEPMFKHTSFRIGGSADIFVTPLDLEDLRNVLRIAAEDNVPLTIVGNGTKLLVSDDGIEGITVKIGGCFEHLKIAESGIRVGAGYSLPRLSRIVADKGLAGLEFVVGIPGTVGGAVVMNAGAHGHSMGDVVTNVEAIDFSGGIKEYNRNEVGFSSRRSNFQVFNSIVLAAQMRLGTDKVSEIKKRINEHVQWRRENQPLDLPNAGSVFKNPTGFVAGKLIDECGFKGTRIGDAKISEKRANFIVNLGNAKASDVRLLIQQVQSKVFDKFHVKLEPEIRIVGRLHTRSAATSPCNHSWQ